MRDNYVIVSLDSIETFSFDKIYNTYGVYYKNIIIDYDKYYD